MFEETESLISIVPLCYQYKVDIACKILKENREIDCENFPHLCSGPMVDQSCNNNSILIRRRVSNRSSRINDFHTRHSLNHGLTSNTRER